MNIYDIKKMIESRDISMIIFTIINWTQNLVDCDLLLLLLFNNLYYTKILFIFKTLIISISKTGIVNQHSLSWSNELKQSWKW